MYKPLYSTIAFESESAEFTVGDGVFSVDTTLYGDKPLVAVSNQGAYYLLFIIPVFSSSLFAPISDHLYREHHIALLR